MKLKDKNIFLLEDDPINFAIIKTLLRQSGAITIHDHWGDETLSKIVDYPFSIDLILLDIMLPGKLDGYDIFDKIRELPELQEVPIVFVSASDREVEIPKAKAINALGYISKPISHSGFVDQIALVLEGTEVWE